MPTPPTIEATSSSTIAISNRLYLSHVNPDLDDALLQEQLRTLFSRYGTVHEVFLSTRSQIHFGFVVMATREEAQRALDGLHQCQGNDGTPNLLSSSLFQSVDAAGDFLPRNKVARRMRERSLQDYRARHHLALSSNIICQVHKSHQKRFEEFLTSENQRDTRTTIELMGSFVPATSKNVALVFVATSIDNCGTEMTCEAGQEDSSSDLTEWLWSRWYLSSAIHRITVWEPSVPSGSGILQGSLSEVVVPAIIRSIKINLLMESHSTESGFDLSSVDRTVVNSSRSSNGSFSIRLAVFPPKLQKTLLKELELQWESTFMPIVSESEQATMGPQFYWNKGISKVRFSPTNATHTLAIVMLHEGVTDDEKKETNQSETSSKLFPLTPRNKFGSLYVLGRLERIVAVNSTTNNDGGKGNRQAATKTSKTISGSGTFANNNYNRNDNTKSSSDDSISRAYWKLQETWDRYKHGSPTKGLRTDTAMSDVTGVRRIRALDCGSSPGGWTKFLYERYHCQCIYSVDPGHLAQHVLELDPLVIRHMPCTIQQAFPHLVKERDAMRQDCPRPSLSVVDKGSDDGPFLDVWVSDMCVKDMPAQVDLFLEAHQLGLVGRGTYFVLTLKCVIGHSHATFDRLVQLQVERLVNHPPLGKNAGLQTTVSTTPRVCSDDMQACCFCRDVQVLHLFSNRSSERTIVGYLS